MVVKELNDPSLSLGSFYILFCGKMVYLSLASLLETSPGNMPILCPSLLRIQFRPHPSALVSSIVKQWFLQ